MSNELTKNGETGVSGAERKSRRVYNPFYFFFDLLIAHECIV